MADRQGNLLTYYLSLNLDAAVKAAMNRAAKASALSREQLCDALNKMAELSGIRLGGGHSHRLTLPVLEKWLNPMDREHLPSLKALAAFCRAVDSAEPLQALAAPLGLTVIDGHQAKLLKRAELEAEIKELQRRKKAIEAEL